MLNVKCLSTEHQKGQEMSMPTIDAAMVNSLQPVQYSMCTHYQTLKLKANFTDLDYRVRQQTETAKAGAFSVLLCGNSPGQINEPGAEK